MNPDDPIYDDAIENKLTEIKEFLEGLPEERRVEATWKIIWEALVWGGEGTFQVLGILEDIKFRWREVTNEIEDNGVDEDEE